jgi:hypothetical protein
VVMVGTHISTRTTMTTPPLKLLIMKNLKQH